MAEIAVIIGTIIFVGCAVAARIGMKNRRFDDRPGPNHIGS